MHYGWSLPFTRQIGLIDEYLCKYSADRKFPGLWMSLSKIIEIYTSSHILIWNALVSSYFGKINLWSNLGQEWPEIPQLFRINPFCSRINRSKSEGGGSQKVTIRTWHFLEIIISSVSKYAIWPRVNRASFFFRFYEAKINFKSLPWPPTWGSCAYTQEQLPAKLTFDLFKVGSDISRTNTDSQWNPVYNAFHRILFLKRKDSSVAIWTWSWRDKHATTLMHVCEGKRRTLGNYFYERICHIFLRS